MFQQPFNMNECKQMLRHYFHATEQKAEPELIDGTTEDEQGYYLGALDTTDSYRIVFSITRFSMAMWHESMWDFAIW